jgi:hypothetical protein
MSPRHLPRFAAALLLAAAASPAAAQSYGHAPPMPYDGESLLPDVNPLKFFGFGSFGAKKKSSGCADTDCTETGCTETTCAVPGCAVPECADVECVETECVEVGCTDVGCAEIECADTGCVPAARFAAPMTSSPAAAPNAETPPIPPGPAVDRWSPIEGQGGSPSEAAPPKKPAAPDATSSTAPPAGPKPARRTAATPQTIWRNPPSQTAPVPVAPPVTGARPRPLARTAQVMPKSRPPMTVPAGRGRPAATRSVAPVRSHVERGTETVDGPTGFTRDAAPATPDAARTLAAERIAQGDKSGAEAVLAAAHACFRTDTELALALARLRESREDWAGAAVAYGAVLQARPAETRWRARRADCLYHAGDFPAAVAEYDRAAASGKDALSPGEYARFGDAALRTGDPATAEAAFTALSRLSKEPIPRVELLRGLAALKQGEAQRARGILLKACARWPGDAALTDALRVASAMHYGDAPVMTAKVEADPDAAPAAETAIVPTAAQVPAPPVIEPGDPISTSPGWHPAGGMTRSPGWHAATVAADDTPVREPGEPRLLPE